MWTPQGTLSRTLAPAVNTVQSAYVLAASPDGSWLAVAPRAPLILMYDLKNPRLIAVLHPRNTQPILQLSFLADCRTLAALSTDSRLTMFDVEAATELYTAQLYSPAVQVCAERRGNYAIAVTAGGAASLHDLAAVRQGGMCEDATPLRHTQPQDLHLLQLQTISALPPDSRALDTPAQNSSVAPKARSKSAAAKQKSTTRAHRSRARSHEDSEHKGNLKSKERILCVCPHPCTDI